MGLLALLVGERVTGEGHFSLGSTPTLWLFVEQHPKPTAQPWLLISLNPGLPAGAEDVAELCHQLLPRDFESVGLPRAPTGHH